MIRLIQHFIFCSILLFSAKGYSQDTNTVELHIQLYDQGICTPMLPSTRYSTSMYQKTKPVLKSGSYFSTIYASVNSLDSAHLIPQSNHLLQSSSLKFNPSLDYELVFFRYDGFNRDSPESMTIKISKLDSDSQVILAFKKGSFTLKKMKLFKKLKPNAGPDFKSVKRKDFKNTLKLDSTAYFRNGEKKAKYYIVSQNYPLYYVQEFDSVKPGCYSQGFHLMQNYNTHGVSLGQSVWTKSESAKYGYWEYFENDKRIKHELWASKLQQKFEWYPSGQLKRIRHLGDFNKQMTYTYYLENGDIKEEFQAQSTIQKSSIKTYGYSIQGELILINTYNSSNGITKQGLQKREIFYPSGKLKMEENYVGIYTIKYYNKDGTEKVN